MAEPARPGSRARQLTLAAATVAAAAVMAQGQGARLAWLAVLPAAASVLWQGLRLEGVRARVVRLACFAPLLAAGALGLSITVYPVLSEAAAARAAVVLGLTLLGLASALLLATPSLPPASTLVPVLLGALTMGSLNPYGPAYPAQGAAALALFLWLALDTTTVAPPAARARLARTRGLRLVAFALGAAGAAWGIAVALPRAQPYVERTVARMLADEGRGYAGMSDHPSLGDIEQLALSPAVVMRAWTDTPQHLRGRVYTTFDGRSWSAPAVRIDALGMAPVPAGLSAWADAVPGQTFARAPVADARGLVATRLAPDGLAGVLLAPIGTRLVRLPEGALRVNALGILQPPSLPPALYGVVNEPGAAERDPEAVAACLQVPADLDPRVAALAARLGGGAASAGERVARTTAWLGRECRYSLEVGKFRSRQPVPEFLFEKKRGYCEYFASAAAMLLRLQGVPTRYVAGFVIADDSAVLGHYEVREADAHAWVEAWLPERGGWVEVDPTPAAQFAALRAPLREMRPARLGEWLQALLAELRLGVSWAGVLRSPILWAAALAAALLALARRFRRRRPAHIRAAPPAAAEDEPELAALLARVDAAWARHGVPRPAHRAPLEHLRGLPPGRLPEPAREASQQVVDLYYRRRFAGAPVTAAEIADLARRADSALR